MAHASAGVADASGSQPPGPVPGKRRIRRASHYHRRPAQAVHRDVHHSESRSLTRTGS